MGARWSSQGWDSGEKTLDFWSNWLRWLLDAEVLMDSKAPLHGLMTKGAVFDLVQWCYAF